jgi:uncharacterized protein YdcH (DUF465 family)
MEVVQTTHRARSPQIFRLGVALTGSQTRARFNEKGEVSLMEIAQEELKAHLMATNEEFRSLAEQHSRFHKELETLEAKPYLTLEDEEQEQRLKKQKLRVKDQMNAIMARYKAQQVA